MDIIILTPFVLRPGRQSKISIVNKLTGKSLGVLKKAMRLLCLSLCDSVVLCGPLCNNKLRTHTEGTEKHRVPQRTFSTAPGRDD